MRLKPRGNMECPGLTVLWITPVNNELTRSCIALRTPADLELVISFLDRYGFGMSKVSMADVLELSIPERIKLVENIWDSIAAVPEALPLTDAQRAQLDSRLEDFQKYPERGSPWEEVKARILKRR